MTYKQVQRIRWAKKFKRKLWIALIVLFGFLTACFLFFEIKLAPVVMVMAEQKAKMLATYIIGTAVGDEIASSGLEYDDIIAFDKDETGKITVVKMDSLKIAQLKAYLPLIMTKRLEETDTTALTIPLGSVLDADLFSGLGPKLKVRVMPVGTITCDMDNSFVSAGINQTRHQILMEIHAEIAVIVAGRSLRTQVDTSVCIAETLIVGDVPKSFADIGLGTGVDKNRLFES